MSPRKGVDPQTVVQAAAALADAQGLDHVTIAAVAKALGIRPSSIYNHVESLDDLYTKLALYGYKLLLAALTHAAVGRSQDDAIRAMSRAYRTFARTHEGLYQALLHPPNAGSPEFIAVSGEIVSLVVRVLGGYGLEKDEALHMTRGLRSLLHGFVSLEMSGQFGLPLNLDDSFERLIETFLAGIRARETRSP